MRVSRRLWAGLALAVACLVALPLQGATGGGRDRLSALSEARTTLPAGGAPPFDASTLAAGLPSFPTNLTHFVYVVRENHVFDDYLGDCHTTLNATCNDMTDYTSQTNHIADTPFLHQWGQAGAVFDNMYSSLDPYSAQGHAFLLAADTNTAGGSNLCSTTVQGMGSGTEWGVYNGSCSTSGFGGWLPDGSQDYPSDGSIFDRFTGPHVNQTSTPIPFLIDGDIIWELDSPSCTDNGNAGIAGPYPHDGVALEHVTCTGSQGWWTNTSSSAVTPIPPVTDPATGVPQELFVCQDTCSGGLKPIADQDLAYAFLSYVADYGLPTYTYIRLPDDHPGPQCPGGVSYDQCIKWNDQSMNLILQEVFNATSPYHTNTVVAVTEDDTQDGQNGPDHINNGRRFPFVLVADPSVMKTGNPSAAACGIPTGPCANVVHPTFNTSNVLAVMERVEMNVNPSIFSTSLTKVTFPMQIDDQLAEVNPLEPVWRCADPRVPCGNGVVNPVLTTTAISPSPIATTPGGSVALTATALDQTGKPIASATYAWSLAPGSLGTLSSPGPGAITTFTAGSSPGNGNVCENATYSGKTLMYCAPTTVASSITLASATVSPPSASVVVGGSTSLHGSATLSTGGNVYPPSATFAWTLSRPSLGTLNNSVRTDVSFSAGSSTGNEIICLNVTYGGTTRTACSWVALTSTPPALTSGTLAPLSRTVGAGGTVTFWAQGLDQYGRPITSAYAWSLSTTTLGSLSTSGPGNTTTFTAGSSSGNVTVSVMITSGPARPVPLNATVRISVGTTPLSISATDSPTSGCVPLSVTFSGTVSGGVPPYSDVWDFGDGTATVTQTGPSPATIHAYSSVGAFTPTLTISDAASASKSATLNTVTVASSSCTLALSATASANPTTGTAPLTVQLTGGATGGSPPYQFAWSLHATSIGTGRNASYTFTQAGSYTVFLNVTDHAGAVASGRVSVEVGSSSTTPTPQNGGPPLGLSWVLWGLLIAAVVAASALLAVVILMRKRQRAHELEEESAAAAYPHAEGEAGYPPGPGPGG